MLGPLTNSEVARALRDLEDAQTDAAALHAKAREIERALALADFDGTEDTRARLAEARQNLRWAEGNFERAAEQLPA